MVGLRVAVPHWLAAKDFLNSLPQESLSRSADPHQDQQVREQDRISEIEDRVFCNLNEEVAS